MKAIVVEEGWFNLAFDRFIQQLKEHLPTEPEDSRDPFRTANYYAHDFKRALTDGKG